MRECGREPRGDILVYPPIYRLGGLYSVVGLARRSRGRLLLLLLLLFVQFAHGNARDIFLVLDHRSVITIGK